MQIRPESSDDSDAVRAVNRASLGDGEAALVDALRAEPGVISLVAEVAGAVVGHILFSPVRLSTDPSLSIAGLGPMVVLPAHQRSGIGSALVRAGLDACRSHHYIAVVVVGHADYYPRFGFQRASRFGLVCEFEVDDQAWMAMELREGALRGVAGTIHYHPLFGTV